MKLLHRGPVALLLLAIGCGEAKVEPPAPAPVEISTAVLPDAALREGYDQKVSATGGVPPYSFAITEGQLPAGLMFKAATGQISGIPSAPGRASFKVTATDSAQKSAQKALTLYVTPDPLAITTSTLAEGKESQPYRVVLGARGGVEPYQWRVSTGTVPAGLTLSAEGVLAGSPSFAGGYDLTLRVTDAEAKEATRAVQLVITPLIPMITTATLSRARFGDPYEERLAAGGGHAPYDWSIASGMLPRGVGLDSTGNLAGTPTESGLFVFAVQVRDARMRVDTKSFSLTVLAPLVITSRSLPPVVLNRALDVAFTAQGGLKPYGWSMTGALPRGLTFSGDGRLFGTAVQAGDFPITVRVQDAQGIVRSAQFTIRVNDQIVYTEQPMLAFPPVCTSTRVSYQALDIEVSESFAIQDLSIRVEVDYTDAGRNPQTGGGANNRNFRMKLLLLAPTGDQVVLCGNAAGVRGVSGCEGANGIHTTYPSPTAPDTDMRVLRGKNAQGSWRFLAVVVKPTEAANGMCQQSGTVRTVELTFRDDRSPNPYVVLGGVRTNNLVIDPWVRITGGDPAGENEADLTATLWLVGPNGVREGGKGDDIPDPTHIFTWAAAGLPQGTTVSPDGHVVGGRDTGEGSVTADDGQGNTVRARLLVTPPDWNELVREF